MQMEFQMSQTYQLNESKTTLRPDFTSKLVHGLAFGTSKFYIAPYGKIKHGLVSLSSNYDVKSGIRLACVSQWQVCLCFQK